MSSCNFCYLFLLYVYLIYHTTPPKGLWSRPPSCILQEQVQNIDRRGHILFPDSTRACIVFTNAQLPGTFAGHGVVSLDPGVRTFQTCFDTDGLIAEWGEADMTKLFQDCYAADRLQKRISNTKGNSTKKHRRRMAWHRLQKIRNKVKEVHKKLSTWLYENYRVVPLPKFETQQMARRRHRKLCSKTARGMCTWAHYRFRQTLLGKAELYSWCKVVVCD